LALIIFLHDVQCDVFGGVVLARVSPQANAPLGERLSADCRLPLFVFFAPAAKCVLRSFWSRILVSLI